jgi:hypothetical protein
LLSRSAATAPAGATPAGRCRKKTCSRDNDVFAACVMQIARLTVYRCKMNKQGARKHRLTCRSWSHCCCMRSTRACCLSHSCCSLQQHNQHFHQQATNTRMYVESCKSPQDMRQLLKPHSVDT